MGSEAGRAVRGSLRLPSGPGSLYVAPPVGTEAALDRQKDLRDISGGTDEVSDG